MTLDVIAARAAFSDEPLGGSTAERLARLGAIVEELRRDDAAAERDRVLQYDAVERLLGAGLLGLRVPTRYGGPAWCSPWSRACGCPRRRPPAVRCAASPAAPTPAERRARPAWWRRGRGDPEPVGESPRIREWVLDRGCGDGGRRAG